ncbi:hypothetical protein LguiA_004536 [Lonicera macranthoides]
MYLWKEYMNKPDFVELMRRLGALGDGNQDHSKRDRGALLMNVVIKDQVDDDEIDALLDKLDEGEKFPLSPVLAHPIFLNSFAGIASQVAHDIRFED